MGFFGFFTGFFGFGTGFFGYPVAYHRRSFEALNWPGWSTLGFVYSKLVA